MRPIIKVDDLGKQYSIGERRFGRTTFRDAIAGAFRTPFSSFNGSLRKDGPGRKHWALRNVNFQIQPGEVVAIVGRNGAGKSTLLKILSRITMPTVGRAQLSGRVSSLLEVGTGFHSELTGRENVFLNGSILGMKREDVKRRFDSIVAFAEVAAFIDTPVKHYSSGMQMRLAFAIAAHLEPDVLLVDEVLAVGDVQFQKKCLSKMDNAANEGRTILFVSHNMAAVNNLCKRGLLLEKGELTFAGTQTETIGRYLTTTQSEPGSLRDRSDRVGSGEIQIVAIEIKNSQGQPIDVSTCGQAIDICLHYELLSTLESSRLIVAICVKTLFDVPVFLQHNRLTGQSWGRLPERGSFICHLPKLPLAAAAYRITYSIMRDGEYLDAMENAFDLNVVDGDFFKSGEVPPATHGSCLVEATWRLGPESNCQERTCEK